MATMTARKIDVPAAQIPGVYRRRIGDIVVTAISDGYLDGAYEFLRNIEPQEAERLLKDAYRPAPPRISVNAFVIHSGGRVALVDTGSADSMGPTLGHLPKHLAAAGIEPASLDTILLTHMHPDHSNGLTGPNGAARFPHVELVVAERDVDHWHDDAAMAAATERQKLRFFQWAREQIKPYQSRRRDARGEVFPGVTALPFPGHTPGHTGYLVASKGEQLLSWGDILHVPDVQTRRPDVFMEPDTDPRAAVATRQRVFDMVATDRLLAAGMHMHFPGFLNLNRRPGGGYELVPELWDQAF
jgi:glyoxylase-like metal-dependent hydrolase (beta-lactamase superfamily II)